MKDVGCKLCFRGVCHHPATPRGLFGGLKPCLLLNEHSDPRLRGVCNLREPYQFQAPPQYPFPPKKEKQEYEWQKW